MISGQTRVFAVVGRPVDHSLSPTIQNAWFKEAGLDAVYVALDMEPSRAPDIGSSLRALHFDGVNLTIPFKTAVVPLLDTVDRIGRVCGAVNVVVRKGDHLAGYNTDADGFCLALEQQVDWSAVGKKAVVLGAGGAGRAVAAGLADRGVARVVLLNRTVGRAKEAAAALASEFDEMVFEAGSLTPDTFRRIAVDADLVVNCTSGLGRASVEALPESGLPDEAIWCDINYWMDEPPKRRECAARDLRFVGGLGMLLHQGALAFRIFTGRTADIEVARAALLRAKKVAGLQS